MLLVYNIYGYIIVTLHILVCKIKENTSDPLIFSGAYTRTYMVNFLEPPQGGNAVQLKFH